MQNQAEIGMPDEGKEAIRTIPCPFHQDRLIVAAHLGLDEGATLTHDAYLESVLLQELTISLPARLQRLIRVVKQVDVARHSGRADHFVERGAAGDVALARGYPVVG